MKILIIIPAYNEAVKIFNVVQQVKSAGYDVVVIDDGSSDITAEEAARAGAKVLRHFVNRGYGAALTTGMAWALRHDYDIAVHFDADGQHEVEDIAKLLAPIATGKVDVVLGSRFIKSDPNDSKSDPNDPNGTRMTRMKIPFVRKILLKAAIIFTRVFSGIKLTDAHNGLRAFSNSALVKIDCRQDGMTFASEVVDQIAEHKLRWCEIPVTIRYTEYSVGKGESNIKKVLLGFRFIWEKMVK